MSVIFTELFKRKPLEAALDLAIGELENYVGDKYEAGKLELITHINNNWKVIQDGSFLEKLVLKTIARGNSEILAILLFKSRPLSLSLFAEHCLRSGKGGRFHACTPIEAAIHFNQPACLSILLDDNNINRPIASKVEMEEIATVHNMFTGPFDKPFHANELSSKERLERTPLELTLETGRPECLAVMLNESNLNKFLTDGGKKTPLMYALAKGNFKNAEWLLKQPGINTMIKHQDSGADAFLCFGLAGGSEIKKEAEGGVALPEQSDFEDAEIANKRVRRSVYFKLKQLGDSEDRKGMDEFATITLLQNKATLKQYELDCAKTVERMITSNGSVKEIEAGNAKDGKEANDVKDVNDGKHAKERC